MKFTVERDAIHAALDRAKGAVERRSTIPVLSNMLLRAENGRLFIRATDLDLQVDVAIPAEVHKAGKTTVPAHMLGDIIRRLAKGAQVSMELDSQENLILKSGRARFNLNTLPASDFPEIVTGEMSHEFILKGSVLRKLFSKTQFAISTEETRYYLNGVFMHVAEIEGVQKLRAVATDGHRLARLEDEAPVDAIGMPGIIVPRKTVNEALRMIGNSDADITVSVSTSKVSFVFGEAIMISKLIDGSFPDYQRVIPQDNEKIVEVDREAFMEGADRVSTVTGDRGSAIKFSFSTDRICLSVSNPDSGSATEEVDADYQGEPLDVGFNARYMLDVCGEIDADRIKIRLGDSNSPALVCGRDNGAELYVIMPMRA